MFARVRASDEMFFPSCLALLGYINPSGGVGFVKESSSNLSSSGSGNSNATGAATSTTTATTIGTVCPQHVTYADWRGQAKGPVSYSTFPSVLVQQITSSSSSSSGGNSSSSSSGTCSGGNSSSTVSARVSGSKRSYASVVGDSPEPAVLPSQRSALFLRKIKFPTAGMVAGRQLTAAQEEFLCDWIRLCLLQDTGLTIPVGSRQTTQVQNDCHSSSSGDGSSTTTSVKYWLKYASELYNHM